MMRYEIVSKAGAPMGTWPGATPTEALCAMHRAAGYRVGYDANNDRPVWPDRDTRAACGDLGDWHIYAADPGDEARCSLCGELAGGAAWYLCATCEGTPEAIGAGYTHAGRASQ